MRSKHINLPIHHTGSQAQPLMRPARQQQLGIVTHNPTPGIQPTPPVHPSR